MYFKKYGLMNGIFEEISRVPIIVVEEIRI
jgi:hypothetical protein